MFKELYDNIMFTEAWDTVDQIFENINIGYRLLGTFLVILSMVLYAMLRMYLWKIWNKDFTKIKDEDMQWGCERITGKKNENGKWQKKNKWLWLSLCILSFIFPIFWKIFSFINIILIAIDLVLYALFGIIRRLTFLQKPICKVVDIIHEKTQHFFNQA